MPRVHRSFLLPLLMLLGLAFALPAEAGSESVRKKTITDSAQHKMGVSLRREFVYGLTLFDGGQYQGTFCPEEIGTIYLVAGVASVFSPRRTDVYYWPLTKEYKADWMVVNEDVRGRLEILRRGMVIRSLLPQPYTYVYEGGYAGPARRLLVGREATKRARAYQAETEIFYQAALEYYREYDEYTRELQDYQGHPGTSRRPVPPKKPVPPADHIPDISRGFILNLPPGSYRIRLRGMGDRVVPGSERELVAFASLGRGIAYEVLPAEKWTSPVNSDNPSETLFTVSRQALYLRPFQAVRFNRHHYAKLTQLPSPTSGRGQENQQTWAHTVPAGGEGYLLEVLVGGKVIDRVEEKPYYVQQGPGYALGYEILDFGRRLAAAGKRPSFSAYKLELPADHGRLQLRLVDGEGNVLPGSLRQVRQVRQPKFPPLAGIALLPLAAGAVVFGWRARGIGAKRERGKPASGSSP